MIFNKRYDLKKIEKCYIKIWTKIGSRKIYQDFRENRPTKINFFFKIRKYHNKRSN